MICVSRQKNPFCINNKYNSIRMSLHLLVRQYVACASIHHKTAIKYVGIVIIASIIVSLILDDLVIGVYDRVKPPSGYYGWMDGDEPYGGSRR